MLSKKMPLIMALFVVLSLVVACGAAPTPSDTAAVDSTDTESSDAAVQTDVEEGSTTGELAVLDFNLRTEPPTLDPALATDTTSVDVIANTFVGLTQFDPITAEVIPYLATDWSVSDDGLEWTFNLRGDIPWIHYDPVTGETTQVTDDAGNPRFVNAQDVVYGVKRTIEPETASTYSYVLYIIKNALEVNTGETADGEATELTIDDVGVEAPDDLTVKFTLEQPAGYFPAIAGMWVAKPMPQWAIEEHGEQWTEADAINTNGPYALAEWIHGGSLQLVKNPLWVNADDVQIDVVNALMIEEDSTEFALYENHEIDTGSVPLPEMDRVKVDPVLSEELLIQPVLCTYYYGFTNTKPPFDDVRIRRAFSAAIDRQSLVDNVTKGGQLPASTFAPPGIFGAPEPGELGLGYDPEFAVATLQEFLDEKGLTVEEFSAEYDIVLGHNTSEGHAKIAAAIQQMWSDVLGVDIRLENQEWQVYLKTLNNDTPIEDIFHVWRMGWCADYPDENNWVYEVFNSEAGANRLRRNCSDANCSDTSGPAKFDQLTQDAGKAADPAERASLYAEAENLLAFEEAAYAPIYHYTTVNVTKPWLSRNFPALGGKDIYNWKIDMAAKLAARGE